MEGGVGFCKYADDHKLFCKNSRCKAAHVKYTQNDTLVCNNSSGMQTQLAVAGQKEHHCNAGPVCCYRYAENQELVSKNSSVMKEQASTIAVLEDRLSKQQASANSKGQQSDKKRIKELEADIESHKVHEQDSKCAVECPNVVNVHAFG